MKIGKRTYLVRSGIFCIFILCVLLGSMVLVFPVSAHSPSSMSVKYNEETEKLSVEITHQVSNLNTHYVNNILITVNEETEIDQDYSNQPNDTFAIIFENVTADVDDEIVVLASCNQGGSITKELTVSSEGNSESDPDSTPGFGLFLFLISIIGMLIYNKQ